MLKSDDIRDRIKDIDDFLPKQYKDRKVEKKRDWRTYEQQLMKRIKGAIRNLEPLIDQSINIEIHRGPGRPPTAESDVIMTLKNPEFIRKSRIDGNVYLFYREIEYNNKNYHMCVVTNRSEGFIITAYITDR